MALKLATDFGPSERLDSIYGHVVPLLSEQVISESDRLEVQIIYGTLRAADPIPLEQLDRFAEVARENAGELAHFYALITAANACRISGRFAEGLTYVKRAAAQAEVQKLFHRLRHVSLCAVRIHIAACAFGDADASLEQARGHAPQVRDAVSDFEILFLDTRVALEVGDLARARKSFESIGGVLPSYSPGRRAYYFALGIRLCIRCHAPAEEFTPFVRQLEELHPRIRGIAGKDFETHSFYLGLCELGEQDAALRMLRRYVHHYRRSNWPLRPEIAAALQSKTVPGRDNARSDQVLSGES